jgi:hypothetical protein
LKANVVRLAGSIPVGTVLFADRIFFGQNCFLPRLSTQSVVTIFLLQRSWSDLCCHLVLYRALICLTVSVHSFKMVIANVGGVGDAVGPQAYFQSLPIMTQYWLGATMLVTVGTNFGLVSPMQVIFSWPAITHNFELWRFATCFLYAGAFDFNTLISVYMLVQFSKQYEGGGPFNTGTV